MDTVHDAEKPINFFDSSAQPLRELNLPGARLRQYSSAHEHVFYEEPRAHTFSFYLEGGYQTHRTDVQDRHGSPDRFCLMPAGSYSAWKIGAEQRFIHVYFDDSYIKRLALCNFDVDPRRVSLPQLTFAANTSLSALVRHSLLCSDWQQPDNAMLLQHSVQNVLLHLLQAIGVKQVNASSVVTSGLSPAVQRRVQAYIAEHCQRQIFLSELAEVAGLSDYHFARMFKLSFAQTPQQYISQCRVTQLQARLKDKPAGVRLDMAQLAVEFGFSNQSHMGRVFKQLTGITPGHYAKGC